MTTVHSLPVPGARLHYEVRGAGPLLILVGAPMDSGPFTPLAEALADAYTVVTTDPRGISRSTVDDPDRDATPEQRADDLRRIVTSFGEEPADVFGSSGGAVTGLVLAARSPQYVRTLVAHEPPLLTLLPDARERLAEVEEVRRTFLAEGQGAAWAKFLAAAGTPGPGPGPDQAPPPPPSPEQEANGAFMLGHMLRGITHHRPSLEALRTGGTRIVPAAGGTSSGQTAHRAAAALAERLGCGLTVFPGGHAGFAEHPTAFAGLLRDVLVRAPA